MSARLLCAASWLIHSKTDMTTKIKLSMIFVVISLTTVYSQINRIVEIDEKYSDKEYRLTGYINTADLGVIEFWAFQKDKKGNYIKDKLRRETLTTENSWRKIIFYGKIQKGINTLTFGIWCTKTIKKFNVDKISLELKDKGVWKSIEIKNGDFESQWDSMSKVTGWTLYAGHTANIDTLTKYSGNASVLLTQQELLKYGDFKEHGASIQVNGVKIYYETYGEGEPLLLLHGNNESISSFRYQIDYFRKKYKVIAVDSRGQGKSSINKKQINFQLMATDMYELLNHLELDSVNLLGWSDGGNTGLIMAMKYPEKVKSLTTIGANLYPNKNAVQKKFLREYKWSLRYAKILAVFNQSKWRNKVVVGKMVLKEPNIIPMDLNKITVPVLVLAGEKDVINEGHTKLIANNIKKSKLIILKGLTHYAPQDDPNYFNKEVDEFVTSVTRKITEGAY